MLRRGLCLLLAGVVAGMPPPLLASPASSDDPGPRGWPAELKAKRDEVVALHNLGLDTTRPQVDRAVAFQRGLELAREQAQIGPGSYRRKMAEEAKLLAEEHYKLTGEVGSLCAALELARTFANMPELTSGAGARWGEAMRTEQARFESDAQAAGAPCTPTTKEESTAVEAEAPRKTHDRPAKPEGPAPAPSLRRDRRSPTWRAHVAAGASLVGAGAALGAGFAACLGLRAQENASLGAIEAELERTGRPLTPSQRAAVNEANDRYGEFSRASAVLGTLAAATVITGAAVLATRNRGRRARAAQLYSQGPGVVLHF